MFSSKKIKNVEQTLAHTASSTNYWAETKRKFKKNAIALWSLRLLYVFLFVAIFGDFIANEKPLYCQLNGKHYFPVLQHYLVNFGLSKWDTDINSRDWPSNTYTFVVMPPIPYSNTTIDPNNSPYTSPFSPQEVKSTQYRHWLGTDELSRDVSAGLIAGTRTAFLIGIITMGIAIIIGVFIGTIAGYFGNTKLKISIIRLILNILAIVLGYFYSFSVRQYTLTESPNPSREILISISLFISILLTVNLLASLLNKTVPILNKKITLPADFLVMRTIETLNSMPGILVLMAIIATIPTPSIYHVMIVIGILASTNIARFMRAELLKVRESQYIEAAEAMGYTSSQIAWKHAVPNAMTPILISISFGIASAILLESTLSFLNIGTSVEATTWGSLLQSVREAPDAWWLAVFPGMAIFITITLFNLIGEGLVDALNPKHTN